MCRCIRCCSLGFRLITLKEKRKREVFVVCVSTATNYFNSRLCECARRYARSHVRQETQWKGKWKWEEMERKKKSERRTEKGQWETRENEGGKNIGDNRLFCSLWKWVRCRPKTPLQFGVCKITMTPACAPGGRGSDSSRLRRRGGGGGVGFVDNPFNSGSKRMVVF